METKNNLILLKANPPMDLAISADIREETAQQKAASIAIK